MDKAGSHRSGIRLYQKSETRFQDSYTFKKKPKRWGDQFPGGTTRKAIADRITFNACDQGRQSRPAKCRPDEDRCSQAVTVGGTQRALQQLISAVIGLCAHLS